VVETSLHALSERYGEPGQRSAREGPVYHFFQRGHVQSSISKRRYAHTNLALNGSATLLVGVTRS
jgi:hypothetical protein